jgi:hypothetical protein
MSETSQVVTGGPPSGTGGSEGKSKGLWVAVFAGIIVAAIAIYFLGFGDLTTLQRVAIFVASMFALLFAFFLALWLTVGSPTWADPAWLKCGNGNSCVAWLLALGGGALVVFILVWVMLKFTDSNASNATVGLPLIVIVGVIVLLIVIALVTFTFSVLGLTSKKEALGLPDGSVRSIIALMLLVLFAILSLYLYNTVGGKDGPAADIAKQLITLLGTLVTAVASFYFASNAVASAHAAAHAQHGNSADPDKEPNDKGPDGSGGDNGQAKKED